MSSSRNESLRLIWLEAFVALAETRTYAAAAKKMKTSPETISRYVDHLELWLWRRLRENKNGIEFTAIGEEFLPVATHIIGNLWSWRADRPANISRFKRPPQIQVLPQEESIALYKTLSGTSYEDKMNSVIGKFEEYLSKIANSEKDN